MGEDGEDQEENLRRSSVSKRARGFCRGVNRSYKRYNVNMIIEAVRCETDDSCVEAKNEKEKDQGGQHPHDTECPWTIPSETHCEMPKRSLADAHLPGECLSRQRLGFMMD